MKTREQWFDDERLKAKKYKIARNIAGIALIGFVGIEAGSEIISHVNILPDHTILDSLIIGAAHGLATGVVLRLHDRKRESESSALKAAAYEVSEKEFAGEDYEPGEWAVSALVEANLEADEVTKSAYGSIIKPKRVS